MSSPRPLAVALLGLALALPLSAGEPYRVYRSTTGQSLKARFEGLDSGSVTLRREDGEVFRLPQERLSPEDRDYVNRVAAQSAQEAKGLNEAAGHVVASVQPFEVREAEALAAALQLPLESETRHGRSWRLYAAHVENYRLFGAMPYSVALYSDEKGRVTSISIVYANKGDFGSTAGFGQDHFSGGNTASATSLGAAMARDEASVSKAISTVLGEGTTQRYGEGKARRKIVRWDWNGHSFLLSNEENDYIGLSIVSTSTANAGGKSLRIKDEELKKRLAEGVAREDSGDVFLSQIPMVDQGPKGYCVPATFERAMRTMGMDADMYLLAMVGESDSGGTSIYTLLQNVRSQVYQKGRRTKEEDLRQLRIRDIKRYIDSGIPVMWTLCSMKAYNQIADANTKLRAEAADRQDYSAKISEILAKLAEAPKPDDNYHICLIVGYNEATGELAVSDSWGKEFERRWVPVELANWASLGHILMILP